MERLTAEQKVLACKVLRDKYSRCIKTSLVQDVLGAGDAGAPTRKCGAMFADLSEHCPTALPGSQPAGQVQGAR